METKRLMIGDLVINTEFEKRVIGRVEVVETGRIWLDNSKTYVPAECIEPIPVTPEILEKIGFARAGSYYILYDDYYSVIVSELTDSIWQLLYNDTEFGVDDAKMNFCYVHQLQQIMRLCGIEKEMKRRKKV